MKPIVEIQEVTRHYGPVQGVEKISISIQEGEIVGLLGPNGCGKTTLIKLMTGLLQADHGQIRIGGLAPSESRHLVSYLPEQTYLDEWMSMDEAFDVFECFYRDFDRMKANRMLSEFGLKADQPLKTMSKGMQEKAHLSLVLSRTVPLYILDEPMTGIDPSARQTILEGILNNYNPGSSLLLSTHLISDVEMLFDRVIFMDQGSILLDEDVESLRSEQGMSIDGLFRKMYASVKGKADAN